MRMLWWVLVLWVAVLATFAAALTDDLYSAVIMADVDMVEKLIMNRRILVAGRSPVAVNRVSQLFRYPCV
jgi:hypothetical protein